MIENFKNKSPLAVILGSGLSEIVRHVEVMLSLPYGDIESMTEPTVSGHGGSLILARLNTGNVILFEGRRHIYEGASMEEVGASVRLAKKLGCRYILITSAAGSLRRDVPDRNWFLPEDVICFPYSGRFFGSLRWRRAGKRGMFPPNSEREGNIFEIVSKLGKVPLISHEFREVVRACLINAAVPFYEGVLLWTTGPAYETRAEIRCGMFMGASAVTMSNYPELVEAGREGVAACSMCWITNYTANILNGPTKHEDVLEKGKRSADTLMGFLERLLPSIS